MSRRRARRGWRQEERVVRSDIKVVSHNIRGGLGTKTKEQELCKYLEQENPDICLIQEAKILPGDAEKLKLPQEYHIYSSEVAARNRFRQRGVITLIKKSLASRVITQHIVKDTQGRVLVIPIQTLARGQVMWVVNIYAPASNIENSIHILEQQSTSLKETEAKQGTIEEQEEQDTKEKEKFYRESGELLQKEVIRKASAQDIVIVGMDANAVINHDLDLDWEAAEEGKRETLKKRAAKEGSYLKRWMEKLDLIDVWRQQHPQARQYTIEQRQGKSRTEVAKRIDMIMVNTKFAQMVTSTKIRDDLPHEWLSDHMITEANMAGLLALRNFTKTIYQKRTFDAKAIHSRKEQMKWAWTEWTKQQFGGLENLNKTIYKFIEKEQIKQKKQHRSTTVVQKSSAEEEAKRREDSTLKAFIITKGKVKHPNHEQIIDDTIAQVATDRMEGRKLTKPELRALQMWEKNLTIEQELELTKATRQVLARQIQNIRQVQREQRWAVWRAETKAGEKEPRYAAITHRQGKKIRRPDMGIRMLKDPTGEWQVGQGVEKVIQSYTRTMWGTGEKANKHILTEAEWARIKTNKVEIDKMLNSEISLAEVERAIKKLKKNKTPGEDLIPNEIMINMDQDQRQKLANLLEQCRKTSKFPKGWKETELKWIYKKADPSQIANYRPIALTNTMYKIFTRVMTERLEKVTESFGIITDLQNGFRTDRSCMAAIMTLNIIMARRQTKAARKPFYVAYIDISKAYDTVNHETLWHILEKAGVQGTWLDNLKELYKDNFLRSYTPLGKTGAVRMERGIRQGCPLSPLLFALYANPIAIAMERENRNKGAEPAMLMYADDMVVWGETEEEVQKKLQLAVTTMEKLGLQISPEKTELQFNKCAEQTQKGVGIEIKQKMA